MTLNLEAPTLAPHTSEARFASWVKVCKLIEKAQFAEASNELASWPTGTIGYSVSGVSNSVTQSAEKLAADALTRESNGGITFVRAADAKFHFEFIDKPLTPDPLSRKNGVTVAQIPLRRGTDEIWMTDSAVAKRMVRAVVGEVGLGVTGVPGTVMGVDAPAEASGPVLFTQSEKETLLRILQVKEHLLQQVAAKSSEAIGLPKLEIGTTDVDAGVVQESEKPFFEFELKNTGGATVDLRPEMSCRCLSISKMTPLKPGEKRVIRIALNTEGIHGNIDKSVVFYTNDPIRPVQEVRLRAKVVPRFRTVPDSFDHISLKDYEPTDFEVFFYATPGNVVGLASVVSNTAKVTTSIEPYSGEIFDPLFDKQPVKRTGYKVRVRFEKDFPAGFRQVVLTLRTDRLIDKPKIVSFQVQKGIVAYPTAAYFGNVPVNVASKRTIKISHPDKPFKILSAVVESGPFEVSVEPGPENNPNHKVVVTYVGKEPGMLNGTVKVTTDMPGYETISIRVFGNAV